MRNRLGLSVLLSLPLALAACGDDKGDESGDDGDSGSGTGDGGGSSGGDDGMSGDDGGNTGTGGGGSGDDGGSGDTGGTSGDGTGDDGGTSGDGGTGGDDPAQCVPWCEKELECFPDDYDSLDQCIEDCNGEVEDASQECIDAAAALDLCLAALSCQELETWWETEDPPYPCESETGAFYSVCG